MLVAELKIVTSFLMEAPAEMLPILDEAAKVIFFSFKRYLTVIQQWHYIDLYDMF